MTTQIPIGPLTALSPEGPPVPARVELDLMDAGHSVGWIGGDAVGFLGFADEHEAAHAAWLAHQSLARRRARRGAVGVVPVDTEPLTLRRNGRREEILTGGTTIATLVRPGTESRSGPDSFGFELRVPAPTGEVGVRAKAHVIYKALRQSGIRW